MLRRLWGVVVGFLFVWSAAPVFAQVTSLDDDFEEEDPCEVEWKCIGNGVDETEIGRWATWFSPDENPCDDLVNPDCANLFDPPEGYVRLTGPVGDARAVMWFREPLEWDNFRLTAEVELLGGSATPADGMAIIIIGEADPDEGYMGVFADEVPGEGIFAGGGGMSATGHGDYPTMIFEFDNWDNGGPDINNNHVGFEYSPTGFPPTDQVPSDAVATVPVPLNGSGRFFFEVLVQRGTVACNLTNEPAGLPETRMYTYKIPNFEPFRGFLGLSGSTGGANQNHILHSISVQTLPPGFCLAPPLIATRSLLPSRDPATSAGDYQDGDDVGVQLTLTQIRAADDNCDAAGATRITDVLPANWGVVAGSISDGGVYDANASSVTWVLAAGDLAEGKVLSYTAVASVGPGDPDFVTFTGSIVEDVAFSEPVNVLGENTLYIDSDFDACGGLKVWNILGAFTRDGGNAPGEDVIREDYLTDGDITELDLLWFPGATIDTDFAGDAASTGILSGEPALGRNPDGVPTVFAWNDNGGSVNLNDEVFGNDPNNVMAYQQVYVINTGDPIEVALGISSDDSVQVILNEEEVWINSIGRGGQDNACAPQDISPDGFNFIDFPLLEDGTNSLIVKVFEGGGGWNSTITFLDAFTMTPILGGDVDGDGEQDLFLSKLPPDVCVAPPVIATRSIAALGTVEIQRQDTPAWTEGDVIPVEIAITDVRGDVAPCAVPTSVTVTETVPAGFTIGNVSPAANVAGNVIRWTLGAAGAVTEQTLSYTVTAGGPRQLVKFRGVVFGAGDPTTFLTQGDKSLANHAGFSTEGFVNSWLLLGPYRQRGGFANPNRAMPGPNNIREDYLTDGQNVFELDVEPVDGETVSTDFAAAFSTAITQGLGDCGINPGEPPLPTWAAWQDLDDTIAFEDYYCGDVNDVMMYAVTYVFSEDAVTWDLGIGSDDSIQVLLNGAEVWLSDLARGSGGANVVQDIVPNVELQQGFNQIMVKVFEGGGGHNFRLRFQDPITAEGITEGLCVSLDPEQCVVPTGGAGVRLLPGDLNYDGRLNISDPVTALNFLFGGLTLTECYAVVVDGTPTLTETGRAIADWTGDGTHNIADAVASLAFQFGGAAAAPHALGVACTLIAGSTCIDACQ